MDFLALLVIYYLFYKWIFRAVGFGAVLIAELSLFLPKLPNFMFVLAQSLSLGVAPPALVSLCFALCNILSQAC
jgi:hypothetical protein